MVRLLRRLIGAVACPIIRHGWLPPIAVRTTPLNNVVIYRTKCFRCHATLEGTWSTMEAAGAWSHYRRSL